MSLLQVDRPQQLLGSVGPTCPLCVPSQLTPVSRGATPQLAALLWPGRRAAVLAGLELLSSAFWQDQCKPTGWSLLSPHPQQVPHPLQYDTDAVEMIKQSFARTRG